MKQLTFLLLILFGSLRLAAQDKAPASYAPIVSAAKQFALKPGIDFLSYSNQQNDFMLVGRLENTEKIYSLVMTDDGDEIVTASNIRVATEVGDNHFKLAGLALAGSNLTAFVESHNRQTGRNVMAMQAVDKNGGLTSEGMLVGYFDFIKADDPGFWHIASSPDQKKIALVAQLPHEVNKPERFKYFFMDENLTMTQTGEFSVGNEYAKTAGYQGLPVADFLVSDKGDLYLIAAGSAENRHFPLVYKGVAGSDQCVPVPVAGATIDYECGNYRATVNPAGELIIAGYFQKKDGTGGMDALTSGSWNFITSGQGIKFSTFETPVPVLSADHLVSGKDTYFLVGCSRAGIHISGFKAEGNKKFEIPVARDLMAGMAMHDHSSSKAKPEEGIASAILDSKLCLIYNDQAGKYKTGGTGLITIGLSVSNEGLAGTPVVYDSLTADNTLLLPKFYSANADHIRVLASAENEVKVITFR
ncbi:MAG TPA: hypothetical protein VK541_17735 [Pedobacter sp.]|uniref:hypothetical protein n=1 Tax=Pedobacter sp. TaxID=1411316 RepID=UPI002C3F7D16|nr:hypothetical protein [Pedobacter sp.]HMI04335.1 hypothetical protein [Pedobacter sp.]